MLEAKSVNKSRRIEEREKETKKRKGEKDEKKKGESLFTVLCNSQKEFGRLICEASGFFDNSSKSLQRAQKPTEKKKKND